MKFKLPNGLVDGGDHFNYVQIDELRGKQQNYLSNKDLVVGNIGHVPKILEDLVKSLETKEGLPWQGDLKEAIQKLPSGDIETILVKVRENTYGERFYHDAECPHCQHLNKEFRLDLDKLELTEMPLADLMDKSKRTVVLPKSQLEVELKPLYLRDMFEAVKITTSKQDELVTSVLALSIKRLGDKTKITAKDIEEIPTKDIMFLNDFAEKTKLEGHIDTDIINECEKCKKEFKSKLNTYDPSFFSPSKGYKSTSI